MSYENLLMYNAVIPSYKKPDEKKGGKKSENKTTSKGKSFGDFISQMKKMKGYE